MVKVKQFTLILALIIGLQGCGNDGNGSGIDTSGEGCGSGWTTKIVRDEFWDVNFTGACNNHDLCYDTCGMTKEYCDDTFLIDMISVCENTYPSDSEKTQRDACLAAANLYFEGVDTAGDDAYNDAQANCI